MEKLEVKVLLEDIEKHGLPSAIVNLRFGLKFFIIPEDYTVDESEIILKSGKGNAALSLIGDAFLREATKPNMLIIRPKLCYAILNEYDEILGYIYWEK